MQFKVAFVASALLAAAAPALGADFVWYAGADCSGSVLASSSGVAADVCLYPANGGSAKSISYSGVTTHAYFYESGGDHDKCTNGATITTGSGSGCATGPTGYNLESVYYD